MAVLGKRGIQSRGPVNLLRTLLTAAVETGALEAMPDLPKAPPPGRKLPGAPSTEEVNAMLANATGWLSVAVALGALAGLRQGEVRALEVRNVDLKQGIITVRGALSEDQPVAPKSGDERVVPIGAPLAEVLTQAMRGKLPAVRVVLNSNGRTPSRQAVLSALKEVLRRHSLPPRSFHCMVPFGDATRSSRKRAGSSTRPLSSNITLSDRAASPTRQRSAAAPRAPEGGRKPRKCGTRRWAKFVQRVSTASAMRAVDVALIPHEFPCALQRRPATPPPTSCTSSSYCRCYQTSISAPPYACERC
jgi:Phage integrase family